MQFGNANPLNNIPPVVKNLLIINVIFFLAQLALPRIGFDLTEYCALYNWRSVLFYPHQLITYMFLHSTSDFSHLLFNMFGLWMFGRVLETTMGAKRFLTYYLLTGIGAAVVQFISAEVQIQMLFSDLSVGAIDFARTNGIDLLNGGKGPEQYVSDANFVKYLFLTNSPMVGASGAIFGILMAFGYMFPNAQLQLLFPPIPIKGKYIAILALVMGIVTDLSGNVAHFAHFGGMLTGFVLLKLWQVKPKSFM